MLKAVRAADLSRASAPVLPPRNDLAAFFFATAVADIAPNEYVARLRRYAHCSDVVFVYALALLRRLEARDARLQISPYTVHRLLITAVMIAAKILDHAWYSNSYYARVGGISTVAEMNALELAMLKLLDFRVFVPADELAELCRIAADDNPLNL